MKKLARGNSSEAVNDKGIVATEQHDVIPIERFSLPVINDANDISPSDLQKLMEVGFCYVKLPHDERYETSFREVYQSGLNFFRQPKAEKMKVAFNPEIVAGYADRRDESKPERFEQFFCRPYNPIGPLAAPQLKKNIEDVTSVFHDKIARPILRQILQCLGLDKHFHELTDDFFSSLSFPYYPTDNEGVYSSEISAHKDFELITVLSINKPGLQVMHNDQWHNVLPRLGHVVVNLSNTLELATSGKCKSALHRVIVPEKDQDRMSMGLFVGLPMEKPVVDLVTQTELYPSTKEYIKAQLSKYDWKDLEEGDESKRQLTL